MAETKNTPSIPESITISGVTYVVKDTPEIQQFMQEVAKVEKSKLYSQFESLRQQIQSLQGVQITDQPQPFNAEQLIEQLKGTFVTADSLKETLSATIKEVVQPVLDATQKNAQNELDAYREKLISENEATCIPELVKGNTKEELDEALKESIRLRAAYPAVPAAPYTGDPNIQRQQQQSSAQNNSPTPPPAPTAQAPQIPTPPPAPQRQSPDANQHQPSAKQMSMAEFAKNRDAMKAQLEAMFGGSTL